MIVSESGDLVKKNLLLLHYEIRIVEDQIFDDVLRMTQESMYHSKNEFKSSIREAFGSAFLMRLFRLLHVLLLNGKSELKLRINIEPKGLISLTTQHVEERIVMSLNDSKLLTPYEREQIDKLFKVYAPSVKSVFEY